MSSSIDNRKLRPNSGLTERKNCEREIESSCYSENEKRKRMKEFDCVREIEVYTVSKNRGIETRYL